MGKLYMNQGQKSTKEKNLYTYLSNSSISLDFLTMLLYYYINTICHIMKINGFSGQSLSSSLPKGDSEYE